MQPTAPILYYISILAIRNYKSVSHRTAPYRTAMYNGDGSVSIVEDGVEEPSYLQMEAGLPFRVDWNLLFVGNRSSNNSRQINECEYNNTNNNIGMES